MEVQIEIQSTYLNLIVPCIDKMQNIKRLVTKTVSLMLSNWLNEMKVIGKWTQSVSWYVVGSRFYSSIFA